MSFKRLCLTYPFIIAALALTAQQAEWRFLGPSELPPTTIDSGWSCARGMGWIESLLVSDDGNEIYAGTITGGIYHSGDGGVNWGLIHYDSVTFGALDMERNKRNLWVASALTHYEEKFGYGILEYNTQSGEWSQLGLELRPIDKQPLWDLGRLSTKCWLAASPDKLYRTEDKGENWSIVLQGEQLNFRQLLIAQSKKKCLVAGSRLYKSEDAGLSWTDITHRLSLSEEPSASMKQLQRIAICEDPNQKDRYLAAYSHSGYTYVDETVDGGVNWLRIYKHRKIRRFDINHAEIAIAPGNSSIVLLGAVTCFISRDSGRSFEQITNSIHGRADFVHDDIRSLVLLDSQRFFLGTDGGVFRSIDGGKSWEDISGKGLAANMIYGVGLSSEGVLVGCQDVGYMRYSISEDSWTHLGEWYGDGGDALEHQGAVYGVIGGRMRLLKPHTRGQRFRAPDQGAYPFTARIIPDPGDSLSMYFTADHVWRYEAGVWIKLTASLDNKGYKVTAFEVNKAEPSTLYFSFDQPSWGQKDLAHKFFKSIDGGSSWANLTENLGMLKWRYITSIASNAANADEVLLSLGIMDQAEVHKVYRSSDGGENWQNWSEGLPPLESFKIMHIPSSRSGYLLATVDGLWYRNADMDNWRPLRGDMPRIAIRDMEFSPEGNRVFVGTYGNGLWALELSKEMRVN